MKYVNRSWAGYLATLVTGVTIGVAAVGTAAASQAGTAAKSLTSTTTVHHYTIAASAFAPDSLEGATNDYYNLWDPSTLSNNESLRCFNAGVALPNGATITSVSFFYTNGATDSFYGELNRQNLGTHGFKLLASVRSTPTGSSPVYTKSTRSITTSNVVNTATYAYSAGVCPFGDSTFSGAMINYTG
jgi:hypothetical protein